MSDGRRVKGGGGFPWKTLLLILVAILCIIVIVFSIVLTQGTGSPGSTPSDTAVGSSDAEGEETQNNGDSTGVDGDGSADSDGTGDQAGDETAQTEDAEVETVEEEPVEPMEVTERADATYEQWLAAGTVVALSMQYPDFELDGIYLTGETELSDKAESEGVYVVFTADGAQQAVHTSPLEEERTESGTIDLYTMDLGFAAFELVDAAAVDTASLQQVEIGDLEELISQSLLVSLYEH